jgi:hypothetical protein
VRIGSPDDDDGIIRQVRVLMRPWPIVKIFREAMYKELSSAIPQEYWELQPNPKSTGKPRTFTPIALKPVNLASDMVLHSPMLAKSVRGKAEIEAAVGLAHQIQSARTDQRSDRLFTAISGSNGAQKQDEGAG